MARVSEGSHSFKFYLPPTRLFTNRMSHPAFTPQLQHITALWPVRISRSTEGRRLSWPGWLVTYRDGMPVQYQLTDSVVRQLGIEPLSSLSHKSYALTTRLPSHLR